MLTDTRLTVTQIRTTAMGLIMVSEVILFQINIFKKTFDGKHEFHCSFKIKKGMKIIPICSKSNPDKLSFKLNCKNESFRNLHGIWCPSTYDHQCAFEHIY